MPHNCGNSGKSILFKWTVSSREDISCWYINHLAGDACHSSLIGKSEHGILYNTTDKNSYIYTGSTWDTLAMSGADGISGEGVVRDIDGNSYTTVIIGNQEWTVQNLRVTKYNDGTAILLVTDDAAWSENTIGAYCWYNNSTDVGEGQKWGALYNWYVVNTGKLAPAGWRVPTDADWTELENYLIDNKFNWDETTSGNKIGKSLSAQTNWVVDNESGTVGNGLAANNRSGFSALPGGYRYSAGTFDQQSLNGFWWSAMEDVESTAYSYYLYNDKENLQRLSYNTSCGFSVRLLHIILFLNR